MRRSSLTSASEKVLVLDFGSQYSQLICRRSRELGVYAELMPYDVDVETIRAAKAKGIILSGGPASVNDPSSPHLSPSFWDMVMKAKIPVLGICYGLQETARCFEGAVDGGDGHREYGHGSLRILDNSDPLLNGLECRQRVWMSHGEKVVRVPDGFDVIGESEACPAAAICCKKLKIWGIQFHPEVTHTPCGKKLIENFLRSIACCEDEWSVDALASREVEHLREYLGNAHVIGAVSGGVDSTVAAALLHRAIGPRFHGVLVDSGLLRKGEAEEVMNRLRRHIPGLDVTCVCASSSFLSALDGVEDPETKRRIIGAEFIKVFEDHANLLLPKDEFRRAKLLQGTLYPDVIESVCCRGPSHTIKTHHNVGGLPEKMQLNVIEPLRMLFKDEVRELGRALEIPTESLMRHPFPGPGLGVRILGAVTEEKLALLREADSIFEEELRAANLYDEVAQAFVVLVSNARSVGVMGDGRTYGMTAVLRAVTTSDFMTADWYPFPPTFLGRVSHRIANEVEGINRICVDITSKPPATIEWE